MKYQALVEGGPGHYELLLGNEAAVRGALEAGVGLAASYPGTPSSEMTATRPSRCHSALGCRSSIAMTRRSG